MAAVVSIDAALRDARLFRGGRILAESRDGLPTGIAMLDAALPWGGFPRGALSELLHGSDGIGELSLLLPALRRLLVNERIALIAPPYLPYPPALLQAGLPLSQLVWVAPPAERALWSAEQCLRAGCLGGVLLWSSTGDDRALRRLQLAAETGGAHAWLFRPLKHAGNPSPAALRLQVERDRLRVLKCRGAVLGGEFSRVEVAGGESARAVKRVPAGMGHSGDPVPSPPAPLPGGEGSKSAPAALFPGGEGSRAGTLGSPSALRGLPATGQSPSPPGRGVGVRVRPEPAPTDPDHTSSPPASSLPSPTSRVIPLASSKPPSSHRPATRATPPRPITGDLFADATSPGPGPSDRSRR